jgi:F-type H+-transporting ATPase subunit delta
MAEIKVARRYAKSLLDLGKEKNITEQLFADISLLLETIRANRELSVLFKSPIVNTDKKDNILKALFGNRMNPVTLEFMRIITRKKREYYLEEIAHAFVDLYKSYKNIQPASVVTAIPLDDNLRNQLLDIIKKSTGSAVELKEIIDKNIIGGYVLSWGDQQIDASVRSKLASLKMNFRKNLYVKEL